MKITFWVRVLAGLPAVFITTEFCSPPKVHYEVDTQPGFMLKEEWEALPPWSSDSPTRKPRRGGPK